MAGWHYSIHGEARGPVDDEEMLAMIASGMIGPSTLVWRQGMENWMPLGRHPDWSGRILAPPVPAGPGCGGVSPANNLAIASMICGLLGLPLMLSCSMGILMAIPAVICGHLAMAQIRKQPFLGGRGCAITGLVTGYITIGLTLLAVTYVGLMIARDIR